MTPVIKSIKVKSTALFNALNGVIITVLSQPIEQFQGNTELFIARGVDFDHTRDMIEGGLIINRETGEIKDDFRVIDREDYYKNHVFEASLNQMCSEKITKRYPLAEQVNVLRRAITQLGSSLGIDLEELSELNDYIELCRKTNNSKKEFYRDHPDFVYITEEAHAEDANRTLEGGIHEFLGPRTVTGGRVFSGGS